MNKGLADIFPDSMLLKYGVTVNWRGGELPESGDFVTHEFGLWLSGFADGESCFSITKDSCAFIIKLRDDDRPLLEHLHRTLRIGTLRQTGGDGANRKPQTEWRVFQKAQNLWLTDFFDRYQLRSKKRRDYLVWKEAVIARYCNNRDLTGYMAQIRAARAYPEVTAA